jgi:hypothetical protein
MELSARTGFKGDALDALITPRDGVPALSFLLGGYVAAAQTPGGELARAVMGRRNWTRAPAAVFPTLIFALFAADLARDTPADSTRRGVGNLAAVPGGRSAWTGRAATNGTCSAVTQFIDDAVAAVFSALKVEAPESGPGEVIADIWNFVVGLGEDIVQGLADALIAPVTATIRAIAGALAIGSMVVSLLQAWTTRLDAKPTTTRFAIDDEVVEGRLAAAVETGGLDAWPPAILDCAQTAGVTLPPLNAGGSAVAWTAAEIPIDLIQPTQTPATLDDAGAATLVYTTNSESAEVATGDEIEGTVIAEVKIQRTDLEELRDTILELLFAQLPSPIDEAVASLLGTQIAELTQSLTDVVGGYSWATVTVIYHEKTETPEPEEEPLPCPGGVWLVTDIRGFLESVWAQGALAIDVQETSGQMVYTFAADGSFDVVATSYRVVAGFDSEIGPVEVTVTFDGTMSGVYAAEGGSLHLTKVDSTGFVIFFAVAINGEPVSSDSVTSAEFLDTGDVFPYECGGDELRLFRLELTGTPIVLTRIE